MLFLSAVRERGEVYVVEGLRKGELKLVELRKM